MAEQIILNLPDHLRCERSYRLAKQVHEVAALTQRKLEDILIEWLDRGSLDEIAIGDLSDEQILKLCDLQMSEPEQTQMSSLLEKQRAGISSGNGQESRSSKSCCGKRFAG
jgi:hypothetical protein